VNVTWAKFKTELTFFVGLALLVLSGLTTATSTLPTNVRAALGIVGGILLTVDKYLTQSNTQTIAANPPAGTPPIP
jgi:hypothetical protein